MLVGADQNSRRLQFRTCLHISHTDDYMRDKTEKHFIHFYIKDIEPVIRRCSSN